MPVLLHLISRDADWTGLNSRSLALQLRSYLIHAGSLALLRIDAKQIVFGTLLTGAGRAVPGRMQDYCSQVQIIDLVE
jgi:hypothetical protein